MDKLLGNGWGVLPSQIEANSMDLYEEGGKLIAKVSLPNFKKDEIKVTTDEGALEISAEHREEEETKNKRRYYFRESSNQYYRRVTLPEGVKAESADANFENGVLKISMEMATPKPVKTIDVK